MNYLNVLIKDRLPITMLMLLNTIGVVAFFPKELIYLLNYKNFDYDYAEFKTALLIVFIVPICCVVFFPYFRLFLYLIIDKKYKKQYTTVISVTKQSEKMFFRYKPGSKGEACFYIWKVKTEDNKNKKIIVFKELLSGIKGNPVNGSFNVTYYRFSGVATNVNKVFRNTTK